MTINPWPLTNQNKESSREVLYHEKIILCCSIFGKNAFNFLEQGLYKKLFTYGCHDNKRGEQIINEARRQSSHSCNV